MIKMLAFDVDGTITASNNEITPRLRAIFDQLEKKGLKLVLATGRPYEDLYPLKKKNDFFPATVLLNGAMIRDEKDNKIFAHYMSSDLVEAVCKILQQFDVPFVCFTKDKNVVYQSSKQTYGQVLGIYLPDSELEMHGLIDSLVSVEETDFNYEETLKIEALFEDISLVDQAREALKDVTGIDVVSSMNFNLEITPDYINKANALQEYVKYEDINEDEEIDKIYQILKYKNEESQRMIDNFFLKKKSLFMLYDKLKNAEKNLKIRYRSLGLEKEYRELDEMIKEFNIEEILEIYTDITEDNIDEYLEEGTYDVANAFQFLDMVNSRLSETASLVMVKTMMIDRELEERKVS